LGGASSRQQRPRGLCSSAAAPLFRLGAPPNIAPQCEPTPLGLLDGMLQRPRCIEQLLSRPLRVMIRPSGRANAFCRSWTPEPGVASASRPIWRDLPGALWIARILARLRRSLKLGCHTFGATGLTAYLEAGGTLENAQTMAAHESPRTTKLSDRTADAITLDEVERITI
jgi:hypothetical protein